MGRTRGGTAVEARTHCQTCAPSLVMPSGTLLRGLNQQPLFWPGLTLDLGDVAGPQCGSRPAPRPGRRARPQPTSPVTRGKLWGGDHQAMRIQQASQIAEAGEGQDQHVCSGEVVQSLPRLHVEHHLQVRQRLEVLQGPGRWVERRRLVQVEEHPREVRVQGVRPRRHLCVQPHHEGSALLLERVHHRAARAQVVRVGQEPRVSVFPVWYA